MFFRESSRVELFYSLGACIHHAMSPYHREALTPSEESNMHRFRSKVLLIESRNHAARVTDRLYLFYFIITVAFFAVLS